MSLGRLDNAYLFDNAVEEAAPLHELDDNGVVVGVVPEELINIDYIRMLQVSQNSHLTKARTKNSTKATQFRSRGGS